LPREQRHSSKIRTERANWHPIRVVVGYPDVSLDIRRGLPITRGNQGRGSIDFQWVDGIVDPASQFNLRLLKLCTVEPPDRSGSTVSEISVDPHDLTKRNLESGQLVARKPLDSPLDRNALVGVVESFLLIWRIILLALGRTRALRLYTHTEF